ncbi:MAG: lysylphosphatidylglycerol synthase transmembrane domain-containing protein [Planctomycetota bacterium]|jgi:uncharacterized membrane protein YbhN (UPF0104 family)
MTEGKAGKRKHLFLFLRIAVVAGGLTWGVVWLSGEQRWRDFKNALLQMDPLAFAVALGFFVISMVIVGLRWWLLLRTQSVFIPLWAAVKLYFLGWFYNNFMPSSVGGDLVRIWYVTRHTDKKFEAGLSVLVDRAVGLLSTLMIAGFFYFLFLRGQDVLPRDDQQSRGGIWESVWQCRYVVLWVLGAVAILLCAILAQPAGRMRVKRIGAFFYAHALATVRKTIKAAILYCTHPVAMFEAFALTVGLQLLVITGFWLVGRSMGIEAGPKYYYTFFTLVWVLGALPVSVGGAVVVEGLIVGFFTRFAGVAAEAALALALCQRIVWMLASLPGAVIHVVGAHLPKDYAKELEEA